MTARQLHRWLGLGLGIYLVLVSLSGALLLYKNPLLRFQYPELREIELVADIRIWGPLVNQLQADPRFRYIKLPEAEAPWLEAVTHSDDRHYYDHQANLRLIRPAHNDLIGWLYDFHLHLLAGKDGRLVMGYLGLGVLVMFVAGLVQWWPRHFRRQLWRLPKPKADLRTMRQWHTSVASLSFPLQLLALLTALALIFSAQVRPVFSWLMNDPPEGAQSVTVQSQPLAETDWQTALNTAVEYWPKMEFRLLSLRSAASDAISMRAKSINEWHPNGRSRLMLDAEGKQIVASQLADDFGTGQRFYNLMYPLHMAAVGGEGYRLLLLAGGLIPLLLFITGLWYYLLRGRRQQGN
ncbi:PepSY domain-containing protein [Bowmanella sp. Y26]|uniref:PepSY-associated TM helix domain-containing protein n=1 Tax=Bowmanella yangjiangensis TaxID=2811230 RepID=UPI001BDD5E0F|nr:PepSY-associated TM helix domain-containing protein [Bowmanella yangjiangensis]MBT1064637.1 PepSY domain-containing protein [Bowmanella yangjiangensis]